MKLFRGVTLAFAVLLLAMPLVERSDLFSLAVVIYERCCWAGPVSQAQRR